LSGKATVYRLYPTKDALVAAYLRRLAAAIGAAIEHKITAHEGDPGGALLAILDAIEADLRRPGFRGCPFNNASIEFDDPQHPARVQARAYREQLHATLSRLAGQLGRGDGGPAAGGGAGGGESLGSQLAVLVDGAYTSAAHLGPDGPAAGLGLARDLVRQASTQP
jgi:AcrR family transcriptional regulator